MPSMDRTEFYNALLASLRDKGLEWVASQVQEQVRSGKLVPKKVAPFLETSQEVFVLGSAPSAGRGKRQKLISTGCFSDGPCSEGRVVGARGGNKSELRFTEGFRP